MENKYYTPSIDEFHVGFEYEIGDWIDTANGVEYAYKEYIIERPEQIKSISQLIIDDSVRVKCLDREDIESLGFEHDQSTKDGSYFYSGTLITENQWCINLKDFIVDIYDINGKSDFRFNGFVRNKSELKRILKMIGHDYNN